MVVDFFLPKIILLLILLVHLSIHEVGSVKDYQCGKVTDTKCRGKYEGQCCSEGGNCGKTDDYCGKGCQPTYGTCNSNAGGAVGGRPGEKVFKSDWDGDCLTHGPKGIDALRCDGSDSQIWIYDSDKKSLKNKKTGKCLHRGKHLRNFGDHNIILETCDSKNIYQFFKLDGKEIQFIGRSGYTCVANDESSYGAVPYLTSCDFQAHYKKIVEWSS